MTERQTEKLADILWQNRDKVTEFHHGDCMGADSEAHEVAEAAFGAKKIWVHPPDDAKKRAFRVSSHVARPRPYLERNRAIVDASDMVIAAPKSMTEELRSGTWATVRYARKTGKRVLILEP
jgi:hypothetical protein